MSGLTDRVRVVLCRPEGSRNVGAVCRAMKNMGLTGLAVVGRRERFDTDEVKKAAVHAYDLFEAARFADSLEEALVDTVLSAGVTRRRGARRKCFSLLPEELAERVSRTDGPVGIVFGAEPTGLTDQELSECAVAVHIPASPEFPSLNLSHAVQIIAYVLFRHEFRRDGEALQYTPISRRELDELAKTVSSSLKEMGYFKITDGRHTELLFRDILTRAALHEKEAARLARLFRTLPHLHEPRPGTDLPAGLQDFRRRPTEPGSPVPYSCERVARWRRRSAPEGQHGWGAGHGSDRGRRFLIVWSPEAGPCS